MNLSTGESSLGGQRGAYALIPQNRSWGAEYDGLTFPKGGCGAASSD